MWRKPLDLDKVKFWLSERHPKFLWFALFGKQSRVHGRTILLVKAYNYNPCYLPDPIVNVYVAAEEFGEQAWWQIGELAIIDYKVLRYVGM